MTSLLATAKTIINNVTPPPLTSPTLYSEPISVSDIPPPSPESIDSCCSEHSGEYECPDLCTTPNPTAYPTTTDLDYSATIAI